MVFNVAEYVCISCRTRKLAELEVEALKEVLDKYSYLVDSLYRGTFKVRDSKHLECQEGKVCGMLEKSNARFNSLSIQLELVISYLWSNCCYEDLRYIVLRLETVFPFTMHTLRTMLRSKLGEKQASSDLSASTVKLQSLA